MKMEISDNNLVPWLERSNKKIETTLTHLFACEFYFMSFKNMRKPH